MEEIKKEIAFIIGIERSGTSLLNRILNNHPLIHCLPEANFFVFFLHKYKNKKTFLESDIDLIFEQIHYYYLSNPWVGWEFDIKGVKEEIIKTIKNKNITYVELCKTIYSNFKVTNLNKDNALYLIDKNPSYTIYTDKIKKALPTAKFIYLVRDYRGNVLSKKQVADIKFGNIAFNATRWKLLNKLALKFYKKNQSQALMLKYEDLVADPKSYIERITALLNIDIGLDLTENKVKFDTDPSPFNLAEQNKEKFKKKYTKLNQDINTERTEAWKNQLTLEEIKVCDAICYPFSREYGIFPYSNISKAEQFMIKLKHFIPIAKAYIDVYKDLILFYISPEIKLNRIKKVYRKLNFITDKNS